MHEPELDGFLQAVVNLPELNKLDSFLLVNSTLHQYVCRQMDSTPPSGKRSSECVEASDFIDSFCAVTTVRAKAV